MIRENVALLMLIWTVLWSVGSTAVQWLIVRGRAAKGEIAAARAALEAKLETLRSEIECKADGARVEKHEAKLTEHDRRVQRLESELPHLPTREQVHSIEIDLGALKGNVALIGQALATNTEIARRVETYLLEAKR